ncbi:tyrosine-type recombinase/integrase [Pseudoruegeria sp. SHC-113]|uniref:tyrosine-type recombinase/integrase n=1 Tax=Pseudoruegeria sp. SHC-113 TaxID=2855439 RepID=UPI0021BBB292|nr:site-specific integrase [Pseudoruegeria sp. SHC-113]MCT8159519.1 site-specific integrase [Pseudoruegeria sp. SHC-113]
MRYLVQPRGPGKSWVFRMVTPHDLVGVPNPWDGKPLGKEIKRGLGTRQLTEARKRRDIALGDIRRLQDGLSDGETFSLASAVQWRETILADQAEAEARDDGSNVGSEFVLHHMLEQAEARGIPRDQLKRFARVATGKGFPLDVAHSQYVEARKVGNAFGFAPLKRTTIMNLDTAIKHLRAHLSDEAKTACLEDVTPEVALRFRDVYLPSARSHRSPEGLSAQTVAKNVNLLKQLWLWAIESGHLGRKARNPWEFRRGLRRSAGNREQVRQDYQPKEFSKLLKATSRGTKEGDLIRLAIATGCRADELATISSAQVRNDGSGFDLTDGKTKNARRFIPVVGDARALLQDRVAAHGPTGRLFPEWPIRPASGKAAAVSQWFTRFRRKELGKESDGRLALHSTRHTWRTVARRANVDEAAINDLGGWAGPRKSNSAYDHGLLEGQLVEAQGKVWDELQRAGYLDGF